MYPTMFKWSLFLLALSLRSAFSDDGSVQIPVEHSFGDGSEFTRRGYIRIEKLPGGDQTAEYVPGGWTSNDQKALVNAAKNGQMYKIRAPNRFEADTISGDAYVMSSTPACFLVQSALTDNIHLAVDSGRQRILSISTFPLALDGKGCQNAVVDDYLLEEFNTTVRLVDSVDGPIPETQGYLQKVEREKQERQRSDQGDNRSFISKYWMYIVPVVVILMISSAMNPEAQGGGGGRH